MWRVCFRTGVGNKGYHTSDEEDSVCTIDRDCSMDDEDAATVDANVCRSSRSSGEARAKRAAYKEGITKRGSSSSAGSCVPPSPVISVAEENQVETMETVQVLLSSHIQPTLRSSFHSIIIPVHGNKSCWHVWDLFCDDLWILLTFTCTSNYQLNATPKRNV